MLTYLALGSNIGDSNAIFDRAVHEIKNQVGPVHALSKYHLSKALNPTDSPNLNSQDFLNAVLCCDSKYSGSELIIILKKIEASCGVEHRKKIHWGPRILDIDILAIEGEIINQPNLKVPHPELQNRDFVLYPLKEIAADFIHPVSGKHIDALIEEYIARKLPNYLLSH